jgi:hypothetical protein
VFDLALVAAVVVDEALNYGFQPVLIVAVKGYEAKGLQAPGERVQHLCGTKDHPGLRQKHYPGVAPGIDGISYAEQAASQGHNFQVACDTAAIFEPQDCGSGLDQMRSRRPRSGLHWGERSHAESSI